MEDPLISQFSSYLEIEKNASGHTINSYLIDIRFLGDLQTFK